MPSFQPINCRLGHWILTWFSYTIAVSLGSDDFVEEKSEFELLRDVRVAELPQKFTLVQETVDNL